MIARIDFRPINIDGLLTDGAEHFGSAFGF